ncbi:MAG: HPr family phosphocarrier protein [Nitrospinae bacterium]|nr:HPr family phosphocarrier protein [Nitrospinota bacterium]
MEPTSLIQIISEQDFLKIVKEPSQLFFTASNDFSKIVEGKSGVSRKIYSRLMQESEYLESVLDEHGARENKSWSFFSEYIACIRNLAIAAFYIKHILDRYPYYKLKEPKAIDDEFHAAANRTLEFINRSILNLKDEAIRAGKLNGLDVTAGMGSDDDFFKIESNKRLPKNILDDEVKEERERAIDLCQKYRKIAKLIQEAKIEKSDDLKTFRALIPSKLDERIVRMYKEHIHSVQSEYDTYVKNTSLEKDHEDLSNFRGYVSMPLHLLEVVLWLCHFYERHEDDIRHGECKQSISRMVNKDELLGHIVNFGFYFSKHFLREGDKIAIAILSGLVKNIRAEVTIPQPLGFHARPSTYISLIARQYEGELHMLVDGEKYNAKSVMSLLQAGGAIADKGYKTIEFEGSQQAIEDVKMLAQYNYCEEGEFPRKLSYLRPDGV